MIQVKHLYKSYSNGRTTFDALRDVNIDIAQGEIFGFIGLSGAGKTSLVRCISALETVSSGEILIDGVDLAGLRGKALREARKKLGLVFQHFHLMMNSTVYENIAFPLKVSKHPKEWIDKRVNELLEMVSLTDKANAYPSKLSGGQKQRVGIARALAGSPSLVICDEATSALDPSTTKSILQLIKDINKKLGITFIVITHEMEVIKDICTKVAILENGEIIESGPVVDICIHPKTQTAKNFFESVSTDFSDYMHVPSPKTGLMLKVTFAGDGVYDPTISTISKMYDVDIAILSGNIQEIGGDVIGRLVIKITGADDSVQQALAYLKKQNVLTEVIANDIH